MKTINKNTIVATGLEINNSGDFVHIQPDNVRIMLWIKHNWNGKNENYAPVTEVFEEKQSDSTHTIKGQELYFNLPKSSDVYSFESFISKFIEIEQINPELTIENFNNGAVFMFSNGKEELRIIDFLVYNGLDSKVVKTPNSFRKKMDNEKN